MKKYTFFILIAAMGIYYFTFVDSWEVYARPVREVKEWLQQWETKRNGSVTPGDAEQNVSGNEGVSVNDAGQQETALAILWKQTLPIRVRKELTGGRTVPGQGAGETAAGDGNGTEQMPQTPDAGAAQEPPAPRNPEDVQYITVEDDYFSDAVFIGDSRTVGMFEMRGLENISNFYASKGLTVYTIFDSPIVSVPGQKEKQTVEQALTENKFAKDLSDDWNQ